MAYAAVRRSRIPLHEYRRSGILFTGRPEKCVRIVRGRPNTHGEATLFGHTVPPVAIVQFIRPFAIFEASAVDRHRLQKRLRRLPSIECNSYGEIHRIFRFRHRFPASLHLWALSRQQKPSQSIDLAGFSVLHGTLRNVPGPTLTYSRSTPGRSPSTTPASRLPSSVRSRT